MNAVTVEAASESDPLKITMMELRERKLPTIIRRHLPENTFEDWSPDVLIID